MPRVLHRCTNYDKCTITCGHKIRHSHRKNCDSVCDESPKAVCEQLKNRVKRSTNGVVVVSY
jgi:hypothetical protein